MCFVRLHAVQRRQSHKLQARKLAICETDPSTWIMERSRLLLKRSQSGNGQEHMYEQWKKKLKSERCDRNSLYCLHTRLSFLLLCALLYSFSFYKLASLLTLGKGSESREGENREFQKELTRHSGTEVRGTFFISFYIYAWSKKRQRIFWWDRVRLKLNW